MLSFLDRKPKVRETSFSKFIREASSGDKKRVYTEVLKKATDRQMRVIEAAGDMGAVAAASSRPDKR